MTGYVVADLQELKLREHRIYQGYYCGMCKSIGRRHGQIPRMGLSYDSVFLALVLAALSEEPETIRQAHCIAHPIRKKPNCGQMAALDYAADMMLLLAYYNFADDVNDGQRLKGRSGMVLLKPAYRKVARRYPVICQQVEAGLAKLAQLEAEQSLHLEAVAGAFGQVLAAEFAGWPGPVEEGTRRTLGSLGDALGQWIYAMDALDDREKDAKEGNYNPLLLREGNLTGVDAYLYDLCARMMNARDLLDIRKNSGIIDNIIFIGMRGRMEGLLSGKGNDHGKRSL